MNGADGSTGSGITARPSGLPHYDDLPRAANGGRSGWGLFGPDDSVGLLNLQTAESVVGAASLVRKGAVFARNALWVPKTCATWPDAPLTAGCSSSTAPAASGSWESPRSGAVVGSAPVPDHSVADLSQVRVKRRLVLGGFLNEYERAA